MILLRSLFLLLASSSTLARPFGSSSGQSLSLPERRRGAEGGLEQLESAGWLGWLSGLGFGDVEITLLNARTTEKDTFPSRSASFTPRISASIPPSDPDDQGNDTAFALSGLLRSITSFRPTSNSSSPPDNIYGCPSSLDEPLPMLHDPSPRFALALRGECAFSIKVKEATRLGAKVLIVGDDVEYPGEPDEEGRKRTNLLTMYAPGYSSIYSIPAIFVSRSTYLTLQDELVQSPAGLRIQLTQDDGWEWPLMDLLFLLLLLPSILTLSTLALHHIRMAAKRRKDRAPISLVESLETRVWSAQGWEKDTPSSSSSSPPSVRSSSPSSSPRPIARAFSDPELAQEGEASTSLPLHGDLNPAHKKAQAMAKAKKPWVSTSEECCICLSDFEPGQIVTILPCGHLFHQEEIASWLTGFQKLCPVCKHDISQPRPLPGSPPAKPTTPLVIDEAEAAAAGGAATETTPLLQD